MKNFRIFISVLVFAGLAAFLHCETDTTSDDLSSAIDGPYSDIRLSSIDPASGNTNNTNISTNVLIIFDGNLDDTIKGTVTIGNITFEDGVNCSITYPGVSDRIVINPDDDFKDLQSYHGLQIIKFKDTEGKTVKITDTEYEIGFRVK